MTLTPSQRKMRARSGGHARVAKHGGAAAVAPARAGFEARFEHQVDPTGELSPEERSRRAKQAMQAHMAALSLRRSLARTRAGRGQQKTG